MLSFQEEDQKRTKLSLQNHGKHDERDREKEREREEEKDEKEEDGSN
jgi:hypothetical protein